MEQETKKSLIIVSLALFAGIILYTAFSSPSNFPIGRAFHVDEGKTLNEISEQLIQNGYVRFASIFKAWIVITGEQDDIKAGDYIFEKPLSVFSIARRLTTGIYGTQPIKLTIPEGWTLEKIAMRLNELSIVNKEEFINRTTDRFENVSALAGERPHGKTLEGYLFPDTYFIMPENTADDIITLMLENLERKITADIRVRIKERNLNFYDVITMASLVEKEAARSSDRRIISNILWKRLELGIALQVDATLTYITEKSTFLLTEDDLKIDSPYNTYRYAGLPAGPIANPGLDAIQAALYPEESPYLYYLSDNNGIVRFAETFEEHKINKFKYLR